MRVCVVFVCMRVCMCACFYVSSIDTAFLVIYTGHTQHVIYMWGGFD